MIILDYGENHDLKEDTEEKEISLGENVENIFMVHRGIAVCSRQIKNYSKIRVYSDGLLTHDYDINLGMDEIQGFASHSIGSELMWLSKSKSKYSLTIKSHDRFGRNETYVIDEKTFSDIKYPYLFIVKGGNELIWYNLVDMRYIYTFLHSPLIF